MTRTVNPLVVGSNPTGGAKHRARPARRAFSCPHPPGWVRTNDVSEWRFDKRRSRAGRRSPATAPRRGEADGRINPTGGAKHAARLVRRAFSCPCSFAARSDQSSTSALRKRPLLLQRPCDMARPARCLAFGSGCAAGAACRTKPF